MNEELENFVPENLATRKSRRYTPLAEVKQKGKTLQFVLLACSLAGIGLILAAVVSENPMLEGVASFVLFVALWIVGIVLYFLPGRIAVTRSHRNALAIGVLNLLLGWTLVGWVVCLVWALHVDRDQVR